MGTIRKTKTSSSEVEFFGQKIPCIYSISTDVFIEKIPNGFATVTTFLPNWQSRKGSFSIQILIERSVQSAAHPEVSEVFIRLVADLESELGKAEAIAGKGSFHMTTRLTFPSSKTPFNLAKQAEKIHAKAVEILLRY